MMRNSLFSLACIYLGLVCLGLLCHKAAAQFDGDTAAGDRPTQRWLPLPGSGETNVSQQVQLLQQLSERARPRASAETPALSESQLQLLDRAVESFRNEAGELELPPLESIPKQWLRGLAADPEQRRQAQRLLEQYAKERNLTLPDLTSSDAQALENSASSSKDEDAPQSGLRDSQSGRSGRRLAQATGLNERSQVAPAAPDSEGLRNTGPRQQAVQQLFEKLKQVEQQQRIQRDQAARQRTAHTNTAPGKRSGDPPSSASRRADERSAKPAVTKRASSGQPASNTAAQRNNSKNNSSGLSDPAARYESGPPQPSKNFPDGNRGKSRSASVDRSNVENAAPDADLQPSVFSDQARSATFDLSAPARSTHKGNLTGSQNSTNSPKRMANPFDESFVPPELELSADNPFAPQEARRQRNSGPRGQPTNFDSAEFQRLMTEGLQNTQQTKEPSPTAAAGRDPIDVKESVAKSGWENTLRRIVQKTLKEQGYDSAAAKQDQSMTGKLLDKVRFRPSDPNSPTGAATVRSSKQQQANASARNKSSWASSASSSSSSSKQSWSFSGSDSMRRVMRDVWVSIATAPSAPRMSGNTASSAISASPGTSPAFQWNRRTAEIVILLLIVVGCLFWLGRRRLAALTLPLARQSQWARSVLAEGLRTRADVVRAYHRFVLQTSQPAAMWWTHRQAASQLTAATPQLALAMNELTAAYEHARYMPPEFELSAEQLERVGSALRQCDSLSV